MCIQQGFPGGALCRYVHIRSLGLSMDLAGYQMNTVPSLQFPFGGDPLVRYGKRQLLAICQSKIFEVL